jgi:hypothetical protein
MLDRHRSTLRPPMSRARVAVLTLIALIAFAANSILCRLAFERSGIDPASFASIRLLSGALVLWLIVALRRSANGIGGSWPSAAALFVYAAAFSFAYVSLHTGVGALLLGGPYRCCLPEAFFHIAMNALASKPIIFSAPTVMSGTPLTPSCLNLAAP